MALTQDTADRFKLFVSYSRRDMPTADALVAMLEDAAFEVKIDRRDLPYGEEWQPELSDFIRDCDTVVWLVSPYSVESKWCNWELGEVQRLNKRLVPVMIGRVEPEALPEQLGKIHMLPVDGVYEPASHSSLLVNALRLNSTWLKEATRMADRAREWIGHGRSGDELLRGPALGNAETWSTQQPQHAPPPSSQALEFILASRRGAVRRQRWAIAGALAVAIMAIGLAGLAWWQRGVAQDQQRIAKKREREAEEQKAVAEKQTERAQEQEQKAGANAKEADKQAKIAQTNEMEAKRQLQVARSRQLAAESTLQFERRPDYALALAASAAHVHPTYEALDRLLRANQSVSDTAVRFLQGHVSDIYKVAFSPDGRLLATLAFYEDRLLVFDIATGKPWRWQAAHNPNAIAFSPDGAKLAIGGYNRIYVADARSGAQLAQTPELQGAGSSNALAWSDDSRRIATAGLGSVLVWDLDSPSKVDQLYYDRFRRVAAVTFGREGQLLAVTVNSDQGVVVWDVRTREVVATDPKFRPRGVSHVFFSRDAQYFVARNDETNFIFDSRTAKLVHQSGAGHDCVTLSADGTRVIKLTKEGWLDTSSPGGQLVAMQPIRGVGKVYCAMAISPDGKLIAVGGRNGALGLWTVEAPGSAKAAAAHAPAEVVCPTNTVLREVVGNGTRLVVCDVRRGESPGISAEHTTIFTKVSAHPNGKYIAAITDRGMLHVWPYDQRSRPGIPLTNNIATRVTAAAFAADRPLLAFGDEAGTVVAWDLLAMRPKQIWHNREGRFVQAVGFSPGGDLLAVERSSGEFLMMRLDNGATVHLMRKANDAAPSVPRIPAPNVPTRIVFSPDSKRLGIAGRFGAAFWQIDGHGSAKLMLHLQEPTRDLAFSPDGVNVALAHPGGTISVRPMTPRTAQVTALAAHDGDVNVVKYAASGSLLVTADEYGDVALWDAASLRRIGEMERTGRRFIAPEELGELDRQLILPGPNWRRIWSLDLQDWIARGCRLTQPVLNRREWESLFGRFEAYPPECGWKTSRNDPRR